MVVLFIYSILSILSMIGENIYSRDHGNRVRQERNGYGRVTVLSFIGIMCCDCNDVVGVFIHSFVLRPMAYSPHEYLNASSANFLFDFCFVRLLR